MSILLGDIMKYMDDFAPGHLAEDYDNVGLLIGNRSNNINRVLCCLEVSTKVVEEAIRIKADLVVSHHPLIFKGLKRIHEDDVKGSVIYKLIRNNISVYSAHTNFDVTDGGLNNYLSRILGLTDIKNLKLHRTQKLYKIVVFVPEQNVEKVRDSMSSAGAGWIGNYSDCSFMTKGTGTFKPLEGTNPYIGSKGNLEHVSEYRLETVVPKEVLNKVVKAMIDAHPYEEVAYDIYPLEINGKEFGYGHIGILQNPHKLDDFIKNVKEKLGIDTLRVIGQFEGNIKNVAVFCGSFDESLIGLIKGKADILVTGDVKYHAAMDMKEMGMCVIDAGHFGTERIVVSRFVQLLSDKFPQLSVFSNNVEEDPFKFC